jgi:hypothetical protein
VAHGADGNGLAHGESTLSWHWIVHVQTLCRQHNGGFTLPRFLHPEAPGTKRITDSWTWEQVESNCFASTYLPVPPHLPNLNWGRRHVVFAPVSILLAVSAPHDLVERILMHSSGSYFIHASGLPSRPWSSLSVFIRWVATWLAAPPEDGSTFVNKPTHARSRETATSATEGLCPVAASWRGRPEDQLTV